MLRALSGGGAYPTAIRWLVVYKRLWLGHDADTVTRALEGISAHCQSDILKRTLALLRDDHPRIQLRFACLH